MRKASMTSFLVLVAAVLGMALLAAPALAKAHVKKVTFTGTPTEPTITVTGEGLGSEPAVVEPAPDCFAAPPTGNDYGESFSFEDQTQGWTAGKDGDCIGLIFTTYTETEVVFQLGSGYSEYTPLTKKDSYVLTVYSLKPKKGKVNFKKPPKA